MKTRLTRQEKKLYVELDQTGIVIEDVYGTKKSSPLFLCLAKALIIFTVCTGTVTGFCDAFQLNYNKPAIVLFTLVTSVLISLLYSKKSIFYVGYVAFLVIFTIELLRYYLYANSGFQAITNRVREVYAEYFNMSVVRSAEEQYTNRYLTITITLMFIIAFLVIMYNITVSRYMNFAETFAISFIILEIPMYIGNKPPILSVILVMTGCICTGLLQKGSFNRVTIPGRKFPDYIRDKFFKKTYYTTRGNHNGILFMLAFSVMFSLAVTIISLPVFNRDLGDTPEDSAKATFDDTIKIIVQNGIQGLFNRYDSTNGLNRGRLGGVSSVSPDFKADIAVSFVPFSRDTVYLPGFKGIQYTGSEWQSRVRISDYDGLLLLGAEEDNLAFGEENEKKEYIETQYIDNADRAFDGLVIANSTNIQIGNTILTSFYEEHSVKAKAEISYIDKGFGMDVYPYVTYYGVSKQIEDSIYQSKDPEKDPVLDTSEMNYFPIKLAKYTTPELMAGYALSAAIKSTSLYSYSIYGTDNKESARIRVYLDPYVLSKTTISGARRTSLTYGSDRGDAMSLLYSDYINNICLKVPDNLKGYLNSFIKEHKYFGLNDITDYRNLQLEREAKYTNNSLKKEMERIISELPAENYYLPGDSITISSAFETVEGFVSEDEAMLELENVEDYDGLMESYGEADGITSVLYDKLLEFYTKEFEEYDEINKFRLRACEAIKDMFYRDYPYTLSPGRTPQGSDYVRYFLEEQKRGFCSHFASAAVMLLRQLGIPARYVEGYCIPYSLMQESATKQGIGGKEWFDADNEFNPDRNVYTVEVSDYYAHAWVEVYLEGKGFVPFEFTPPSFEAAPSPTTMTGIGGFFARLFDVDLGFDSSSESSLSITGDDTTSAVDTEKSGLDLSLLLVPLGWVIGSVAAFWIIYLLIKKLLREIRYAKYIKEEKYAPVILARYEEFVKKLKKKKIVTVKNPLPLELCEILSDYKAERLDKDASLEKKNELKKKTYEECRIAFSYAEKVLYSDYKTNEVEYKTYYSFITGFLTKNH